MPNYLQNYLSRDPARKSIKTQTLQAAAIAAPLVLIILSVLTYKTLSKPDEPITYARYLMGTIVEITVKEARPGVVEAAFAEIERLEALMSSYIPTSDVSKVTAAAGGGKVTVSPEVIEVVETAVKVARLSGGAFDPTVGVLGALWDFGGESARVPEKKELEKVLLLVDYTRIIIDPDRRLLSLGTESMRLDLGGIAKGYIVMKAVQILEAQGVRWGIIRAGGDMVVFQEDKELPGAEPFTIGIQHPRESGKLLGAIRLIDGAFATSGDYERFFIKGDERYHHILDPATGYPARGSRSVTIIAASPADPTMADGLSTAVFVMGPTKGMALIESIDGVEGVIVDSRGEVFVSTGLGDDLTIFDGSEQ